MKYDIIIGENGNEQGHIVDTVEVNSPEDYARLERRAKRLCKKEYCGDGWYCIRES